MGRAKSGHRRGSRTCRWPILPVTRAPAGRIIRMPTTGWLGTTAPAPPRGPRSPTSCGGSLYRRVLLIRQPAVAGLDSAQPTDTNGAPLDLSRFEAGNAPTAQLLQLCRFLGVAEPRQRPTAVSQHSQPEQRRRGWDVPAVEPGPAVRPRSGHRPPRELDKNGVYFGRFTHGKPRSPAAPRPAGALATQDESTPTTTGPTRMPPPPTPWES